MLEDKDKQSHSVQFENDTVVKIPDQSLIYEFYDNHVSKNFLCEKVHSDLSGQSELSGQVG